VPAVRVAPRGRPTRKKGETLIRAHALVALVAVLPAKQPVYPHHRECHSRRCAAAADKAFNRVRRRRRARALRRLAHSAGASWYDDAGGTACGFHAKLGVASHYEGQPAAAGIPCHTRLRMCYRRCATVTVQDRGPFVAGREIDLNPGARAAIGFGDVGSVRYRVLR